MGEGGGEEQGKIVEKERDLTRRKISINNRRMATPGSCVEQGFPLEGAG